MDKLNKVFFPFCISVFTNKEVKKNNWVVYLFLYIGQGENFMDRNNYFHSKFKQRFLHKRNEKMAYECNK